MSDTSKIQWTDASWNFVTGCTKVSDGCLNCYIPTTPPFRMAGRRFNKPGIGGTTDVILHPDRLALPLKWRKPRKIFVNSLSDVFHEAVPDELIARGFATMAATPHHVYQLLTKRHARMRSLLSSPGFVEAVQVAFDQLAAEHDIDPIPVPWPLANVHLGVSVENQKWAAIRISALLDTPAAVRWISAEPLLGPLNIWQWIDPSSPDVDCDICGDERFADEIGVGHDRDVYDDEGKNLVSEEWCTGPSKTAIPRRLAWVVAGGESGPGARPMDIEWIRSLIEQCKNADVPIFTKQLGSVWAKSQSGVVRIGKDAKGGKPEYWPEDLRVRKYPQPAEVSL